MRARGCYCCFTHMRGLTYIHSWGQAKGGLWKVQLRSGSRYLQPQLKVCRAEHYHKGALPSHYEGRNGERRRSKAGPCLIQQQQPLQGFTHGTGWGETLYTWLWHTISSPCSPYTIHIWELLMPDGSNTTQQLKETHGNAVISFDKDVGKFRDLDTDEIP